MTDAENDLTWTDVWADITGRLGSSDDARRIIERASGQMGAPWLVMMTEKVPHSAIPRVAAMVERRLNGEPLQYIVGRWGFRNLELVVDERVLIPRPETEQVVEAALTLLKRNATSLVADLGTGSGAIALAIAKELRTATVYATDQSLEALEVARTNLEFMDANVQGRVHLSSGTWFDALPTQLRGSFDMIISNPPYVAESRPELVERVVHDWEPHQALYSGADGLDDIRLIVAGVKPWLAANGCLVLEMAPDQIPTVKDLLARAGFRRIEIGVDFLGRQRWIMAR